MDPNYVFGRQIAHATANMIGASDAEIDHAARTSALAIVQRHIPHWRAELFRSPAQIDEDVTRRAPDRLNILIYQRSAFRAGQAREFCDHLHVVLRYSYSPTTWPFDETADPFSNTYAGGRIALDRIEDATAWARAEINRLQSIAETHYGRRLHVQNNTKYALPHDGLYL